MKVLLTGATGFIGRHVLARLVDRRDQVRVLALPETVRDVIYPNRIQIITGSLGDRNLLARAARNITVVVHLAAKIPGPAQEDYRAVNVGGTVNLLEAAVNAGVKRFVFMSSTAVYGLAPFPSMWPIGEESPLAAHGTSSLRQYGASKIEAENAVTRASKSGVEYVILRPTVAYGRGAVAAERLLLMLLSAPAIVRLRIGTGGAVQWVHISDLVEVAVRAMLYPAAANQAFNVVGPEVLTIAELAAAVRTAVASPWSAVMPGPRAVAVRRLRFESEKTARLLAYRPQIGIRQGLADMFSPLRYDQGSGHDGAPA